MNREIKFRGWDGKQFHYFDLDEVFFQGAMNEVSGSNQWSPSNLYIQQFTGLHDKNGKEIYEGDILMYRNNMSVKNPGVPFDSYHKVCFGEYDFGEYEDQEDGYGWYIQDIDVENYGSSLTPISSDLYEVIGNINENPELLK